MLSTATALPGPRRPLLAGLLAVTVLIGSAGLATDTIQLVFIKRVLQRQAGSGPLAGAFALAQGKTVAATATADLAKNTGFPLAVDPVIENAPTAGSFKGNTRAVRVVLATDRDPPFLGMFMGEHCALALDTGNVTGVRAGGDTTVDLNCDIMAEFDFGIGGDRR
jgi:hypothetical protein